MNTLKPVLDKFHTAYMDMLETHTAYLEPHRHSAKNGIPVKSLSSRMKRKIHQDDIPLYSDDMTVGMLYGHYWGNAACHHIEQIVKHDMLDVMFVAEYHHMNGMEDTGQLHKNPYRRYDALYACVEIMKQDATAGEQKNFAAHQQNIVKMVRADRALYMQAATEMDVLKGNEEMFDRFWQTNHYNPKNADRLQYIIR